MVEKSPDDCKNDGCCGVVYFGFYSGFFILPNNPPLGALLDCDTFPNKPPVVGGLAGWVGLPNSPPLGPPSVDPENNDDPSGLLENNPELGASDFLASRFEANNPPAVGLVLGRPPNVSLGAY